MEPESPYPAAGETVNDRFRIEKKLGEGGMGAVCRALHLVLGGPVALKFMNPQFMSFPGAVERFLNEGRASNAIKSDHVLPVTDVGSTENGTPFLVMECLYGLDLADLLARDGPSGLPIERAMHFTIQILRGLQAAHAINIIHRDMKPSNCFVVTHDGQDDFVKILDFGISKVVQPGQSSLTQTNSALGTPLYMSPEQARSPRDVDHRSDIYSVGVILYELLCGRTPFFSESGEFTEILFQLFTADPPPIRETRPDLPEALAVVVHKALAREVADRFSSSLEFAEALVPFASAKSAVLVERMRGFKPPTKDSIVPAENGLPTSMAAFSQLAHGRGQGTDVMVNRPTTDVQKGSPVTEVIIDAPKPLLPTGPKKTALLEKPPESSRNAGRTQFDARVAKSAAQTDLGASVDAVPVSAPEAEKRSPLIYAIPAIAALVIGAGVMVVFKTAGGPSTTGTQPTVSVATTTPSTPSTTSAPPAVTSAAPSAAASVPVVPSASSSAPKVLSGVPAPVPAPPPRPAPQPGHQTLEDKAQGAAIKN